MLEIAGYIYVVIAMLIFLGCMAQNTEDINKGFCPRHTPASALYMAIFWLPGLLVDRKH